MPDLTPTASPAAASLARFHELRLLASALLREASRLPSLPALHVRQAEASANIAGMKLHRIHGQGCADDAMAIRADVEAIGRAVDPLLGAIGDELGDNFHGIDRSLFIDQLLGAVDGNATFECDEAARRAAEDDAEAKWDTRHPGTHRAAYAREA